MGQLGSQDISNHPHWIVLSTRLLTNAERPAHIHKDKPPTCFFTLKKNLHKHSSQHFLTLSETLSPLLCPQGIYLTNFELQASSSFQLTKIMLISDSFSRPDADMGLQKTYTSRGKSHKYYKTHQVPTHTHNTVRTAACNFSWCDF